MPMNECALILNMLEGLEKLLKLDSTENLQGEDTVAFFVEQA
jgi:hypothetical protein